jgi:hypothetical protein
VDGQTNKQTNKQAAKYSVWACRGRCGLTAEWTVRLAASQERDPNCAADIREKFAISWLDVLSVLRTHACNLGSPQDYSLFFFTEITKVSMVAE